jgi:hydroxymethylpyrimidine/phosphomethylpyrimidine kinase
LVPRALTIAGSDSGGGAGVQADLKAFAAAGLHGMSAIVALTAQNTVGVTAVHEVPAPFVVAQLDAVFSDLGVDAAKTGMLFSREIIEAVAGFLERHPVPLVVDPVMVASSGSRLLQDDAADALVGRLFPLATVVTPNLAEAQALCGDCTHSATLAALLAQGRLLEEAARAAAQVASDAVRNGLAELGAGDGPVDVFNLKGRHDTG